MMPVPNLKYDIKKWSKSSLFVFTRNKYHPGGEYELRSASSTADGHGNQCIYDSKGKLIKTIPGAGTADYSSPDFSIRDHKKNDVKPFDLILELKKMGENVDSLYQKYYDVRPSIYQQGEKTFMNGREI